MFVWKRKYSVRSQRFGFGRDHHRKLAGYIYGFPSKKIGLTDMPSTFWYAFEERRLYRQDKDILDAFTELNR